MPSHNSSCRGLTCHPIQAEAKKPEEKKPEPKKEEHDEEGKFARAAEISHPYHHRFRPVGGYNHTHPSTRTNPSMTAQEIMRTETQRLQWEKTEQALAKSDDGPFKKFGGKMKGHFG